MSAIATTSDIALIRRFADQRDQSAFTEICRRYAGMVYAASYRVLQDRQLAEDAVQETFLKLLRRPDVVNVSLGGWLHKAATQHAIDVARSESSRRAREKAHSEKLSDLLDENRSWREISATVDSAMLELPEEARDILVQHFILGRSQKEIAEEREVSIATICRRVNDAMEQLRAVLQRRGVTLGAISLAGGFLSMYGMQAISATLQQELGKMVLVAGLRRIVPFTKPLVKGGLSGWQIKELQLAASVAAGSLIIMVAAAAFIGHRPIPEPDRPATTAPHQEPLRDVPVPKSLAK